MLLVMPATTTRCLQHGCGRRRLCHMRLLALAACVLATAPALAGRRASFRVGAEVVSSARLLVTPSGAVLGVETRSFGSRSAAVLLAQRSGSPVRLLDGS